MTEEELEYGAVPQHKSLIPDGMRVCVIDLQDEPKKIGVVYKGGVPVFKVRSKYTKYIGKRLWNYINNIPKEEKWQKRN